MGAKKQPELSTVLPPCILGTAGFSHQLSTDPFALPTNALIARAFSYGVRAFDTSPYYGPAEELLGQALNEPAITQHYQRNQYFLITKCGRISGADFDYSPSWIQQSVQRSLQRLHSEYLDLVYCHDVEFVSPKEVLTAVKALRRIRDEEGTLKYVGISGYPIGTLCDVAEMILRETGEPLDAVMSYCHFTLQNRRLKSSNTIVRLKEAGVKVVPNASPLGMGLLRDHGVPIGADGDFHPSSVSLREACHNASRFCLERQERLTIVALRFAIEGWMREGASVGSTGPLPSVAKTDARVGPNGQEERRLGVTVLGSSDLIQFEEAIGEFRASLAACGGENDSEALDRDAHFQELANGVQEVLGEWIDVSWESPSSGMAILRNSAA